MRVVEHFVRKFKEKHGKDIKSNLKAFHKLKDSCEKAKRILSNEHETTIEIESLMDGIDFKEKLRRAKFEELNKDLFTKVMRPIEQVLRDSKTDKSDIDTVVLVGGSTRIPWIRENIKKYFNGKDLRLDVNPDEAIAYGAAVQAAILDGVINDAITLLDVTPLSLGIETVGGVMAKIIHRNTLIPTEKSDIFTTSEDYQDTLIIPIYEGERTMCKYNRKLGEIELTGIPPAKKGVPEIKVVFSLDKNSILSVTVEDQATKNVKKLTIRKGDLTAEEIKRMQQEAKEYENEDKEFLDLVNTKTKLEDYCNHLKNQMLNKAVAQKVKSKDRKELLSKVKQVIKWLRNAPDDVKKKDVLKQMRDLKKIADPIVAAIYGKKDDFLIDLEGDESDDDLPLSDDEKPITAKDTHDITPKKAEIIVDDSKKQPKDEL